MGEGRRSRDAEGGEAELVHRLRAGDETAFATLVQRYQAQLLRLAMNMVPSRAVAEEVVQETWLGVVRGIGGFEGRSSVKTWLFRMLMNRARSAGGREFRAVPVDLGVEPSVPAERFDANGAWATPPTPWADETDDRLTAERLAATVRGSLGELPDAQRQVLLLRDIEGVPAAEVCELLGLSDGNQRVLLHRARARVRDILEREMGKV
ncbi:MAG: RNA polymerase sigma factor [Acidimicrobiales bacterium]